MFRWSNLNDYAARPTPGDFAPTCDSRKARWPRTTGTRAVWRALANGKLCLSPSFCLFSISASSASLDAEVGLKALLGQLDTEKSSRSGVPNPWAAGPGAWPVRSRAGRTAGGERAELPLCLQPVPSAGIAASALPRGHRALGAHRTAGPWGHRGWARVFCAPAKTLSAFWMKGHIS